MSQDLKPKDPRVDYFPDQVPTSHQRRETLHCDECEQDTPHDLWQTIFGVNVGFRLPLGRKSSTAGKLGRRSHWWTCAVCGDLSAADEAALELARSWAS
jgi:hypothetical protein